MKKLQQTLIIGALLLSPLAITQVAGAQLPEGATCPTGYIMQTGPDSKDICVSEKTFVCTVGTNNQITIENESDQYAFSDEVKLVGNTGSGNTQSGNGVNTNGVTFAFTITNPGVDGEETCVAATTVAPIIPEEKPAPQPEPVPAPEVKAAPKLATTAGDNTVAIVAGVLGATTVTLAGLKTASWLRRR